jgi:predicted amidohydrolase YtcJ
MQALRTYTWNSAYCMFWEHNIGSLEPGKYADLVVWDKNPLTAGPDDMLDIKVKATMVDGKWVYKV